VTIRLLIFPTTESFSFDGLVWPAVWQMHHRWTSATIHGVFDSVGNWDRDGWPLPSEQYPQFRRWEMQERPDDPGVAARRNGTMKSTS